MSEVRGEERSVGELDRRKRDELLREVEVTPTIDACTAFEVGRRIERERFEKLEKENELLWQRLQEIRLVSTRRLPL